MKKQVSDFIVNNIPKQFFIEFPREYIDELKAKLSDENYSLKQFYDEYGFLFNLIYKNDVQQKLNMINNKLGFFIGLIIISIIIGLFAITKLI
jgi:hypothetical protein